MKSEQILEVCCRRGKTIKLSLTGQTGTGKGVLLAEIMRHLREIGFTVKAEDDNDDSIVINKSVNAHE